MTLTKAHLLMKSTTRSEQIKVNFELLIKKSIL